MANSIKNLKNIAMPGLPGQGFIIIIIIIMSHRASTCIKPPCCLTNTFCLVQPLWLLPSSSSPLCFTLSQPSVTWGLLWSLSAFGLPADFVPRASMLPQQVTPPVSVLLFSVTIDLIHDTRHLCTPFRIDGIKAMSGGISGGEQKIKFANVRNCSLLCLFSQNKTTI